MTLKEAKKKYLIAQFLSNKGLWKAFKVNYEEQYPTRPIEGFLERNKDSAAVINRSFSWGATPEGLWFWSDLSEKFEAYFKKHTKENY